MKGKLLTILIIAISLTTQANAQNKSGNMETATIAGGCFWCTEAVFKELKGVKQVTSGYSGGEVENPTYKQVTSGLTGHAEAIKIEFDASVISFAEILEVFFATHDPTTLNQQGADRGAQYRSAIFYHNEIQKEIAESIIAELTKENVYNKPVVTEVTQWENFYNAEDYHQDYYELNPYQGYCQVVIVPKLEKFKKIFKDKLKD